MAGSNFSIVNAADGTTKIPISTPANDANGNTAVGHLVMTAISGIATPVDFTHPLPVGLTALPLPAGAAVSANQPALNADGGALAHVTNFPPAQAVTQSGAPWSVSWSGQSVAATQSGTWTVALAGGNATALKVDGSAITQPVSGAVSVTNFPPAQAVTQSGAPWSVSWSGQSVAATQSGTWTVALAGGNATALKVDGSAITQPVSGAVSVTNFPATLPVSAVSLPLPVGAATAANQPTLNADGGALAHITNFPPTQAVTQSGTWTVALAGGNATALKVDGSAITQPVSGAVSVTNFPATQAVSAAALPLPAGAAQDGTDATGVTPPTGAVGIRGWLSGLYKVVSGTLKVQSAATSITTGVVSIGTTATLIVAARTGRSSVLIEQESSTVIRIGASGVTLPTGLLLPGVVGSTLVIEGGAAVYGIAASGTQSISFLEIY